MQQRNPGRTRSALALILAATCAAGTANAQTTDFCGCAGSPDSLGALTTTDLAALPAGTTVQNDFFGGCQDRVLIPLPADGVMVFDSMTVSTTPRGCLAHIVFLGNAANTPVTLLVKGDVTLTGSGRINASGFAGGSGTAGGAGLPGGGGPGGFAGGEGAYQVVNFASTGGNGVGPGGGLGAVVESAALANGGVFVGVPELRPLLGGSGGGGGRSGSASAGNSGGGGGGGGGALLIAANGTLTNNGVISANGGDGGSIVGVSTGGGGGSGGAIRLLANTIQGSGTINANGGNGGHCCGTQGNGGGAGRIRMEAIFNTFSASGTSPVAVRAPAPGPLVNPITPTVRITAIDGAASPVNPIGFRNSVDMIVDAPGVIQVDLATTDVPAGTDLEVTVKPKVGAPPVSQLVTIAPGSCTSGACNIAADFDLAAGAYIVEARATFQTP